MGRFALSPSLLGLSEVISGPDKYNPPQKENENNVQSDGRQYFTDAALHGRRSKKLSHGARHYQHSDNPVLACLSKAACRC